METNLRIEYQPIDSAKTATGNPKDHDLATIKASIQRWGFCELPAVNERTGRLVAGHGRREALLELRTAGEPVPVNIRTDEEGRWLWPVLRGNTFKNQAEADAYLIATNNAVIRGGFNLVRLAKMLDGVRAKVELVGTGYTSKELDRMIARHVTRTQPIEPAGPPEPPKSPVTKAGDLWILGRHLVVCGDCRDHSVLGRLLPDGTADMVSADPPYGMGKEADGIVGDNQYGAALDAFQTAWWQAARRKLKATGAAYVWGNAPDLWRWWYSYLVGSEPITFRNEIVWLKPAGSGQNSIKHLQYPTLTERCLFFALGQQGLGSRNSDRYWPGWDPIRLYLASEAERLGLKGAKVGKITGTKGMFSHWFSTSQWLFITREAYQSLQRETGGFPRSYEQLKTEHDALRVEFELQVERERAYHDNTHESMSDVWEFGRVSGAERHGHATPKPVLMMARELLTSCPANGVVLAPFGGTGPELLAAEQTDRVARVVELQPGYVDVIVQRWEELTGGKARRE